MNGISFATRIIDSIAPRLCTMCGNRLSPGEEYVCGVCQLHIPRTSFHLCPLDNIMTKMFWGQIPIERATALFFYQPQSNPSRIIYSLKYNNNPDIGIVMGRTMATEILNSSFLDGISLIIPVPLSPKRLRQRGYNQSERLARGFSDIARIPVDTTSVIRTHFTQSQTRLTRLGRMDNVEDLFQFRSNSSDFEGKHILLIDDVTTTGATIIACANAMKDIPNIRFSIMTLAFTHNG